jgi:hypothetical protein
MTDVRALWLHALTAIVLYASAAEPPIPVKGVAVLVFVRSDCPISNRYAPELIAIYNRVKNAGVGFTLVHVDPDEPEEAIQKHRTEFGYPFPAVKNPDLAKAAGARTTPEVAIYSDAKLVYRGRIDDRYVSPGISRRAPTVHDLDDVLQALLRGERVPFRSTRAVGCSIQDLQ